MYSGVTTGSVNGTNYVCLPNHSEYYPNEGLAAYIAMDRVGMINHTSVTPCFTMCAVCYTSNRSTILMIPGKLTCPANWISEYSGFLMTDLTNHSQHECIDESRNCMEQTGATVQTEFFTVYHNCDDCPKKPLTCVVCSR